MEESLKECLPELNKLVKEKEIRDFTANMQMVCVYQGGSFNEEEPGVMIKGKYKPDKAAAKEEFLQEAQKILSAKKVMADIDLEVDLKGEKFPTLEGVKPVLDPDAKPVDLAPKEGEVTLFDFWATWCGPCQGPMAHNQKMLEEHPEWEGKVRIVGVSIDNSIENPRERVNARNWKKVDHYWAEGGWGSKACKAFGISGIPFCVLVDKTGTIQLFGHPMEMNLEKNLPLLAAGGTIEEKAGGEEKSGEIKDKSYTFAQCKADMEKLVKDHEAELANLQMPLLAAVFQKSSKGNDMESTEAFLVVRFLWSKKVEEAANKYRKAIEDTFGPRIDVKFQTKEQKIYSLEFGKKCEKCGKELGKCDQYTCVLCKPSVYFCMECVDAHKDPTTVEELVHPHGLYFIQKESESPMTDIILGDLKAGSSDVKNKRHGMCMCDYCSTTPIGIRWKCANCPQVDVCDACFRISRNPADPKHQELVDKAKQQGHDMKTHVYIRQDFVDFVRLPY